MPSIKRDWPDFWYDKNWVAAACHGRASVPEGIAGVRSALFAALLTSEELL